MEKRKQWRGRERKKSIDKQGKHGDRARGFSDPLSSLLYADAKASLPHLTQVLLLSGKDHCSPLGSSNIAQACLPALRASDPRLPEDGGPVAPQRVPKAQRAQAGVSSATARPSEGHASTGQASRARAWRSEQGSSSMAADFFLIAPLA